MNEELNDVTSRRELSFGQRLRRERESRQWTQVQLSITLIGDDSLVPSIYRWEKDRSHPHPPMLAKLSETFGKPPERWGTGILVYWHVPFLQNPYFTGRAVILQHLHRNLAADKTHVSRQICAISGLGGIGKTQTAIEYAYRYRSEYEAVLWLRASSHESLITDFVRLALVLGVLKKEETDQTRIIAAITRWLGERSNWLLVFDNVDDLDVVLDFFPQWPRGAILLTTRSRIIGSRIKNIALEKMSQEEGTAFLLRRIAPDMAEGRERDIQQGVVQKEQEAASELWEVMGGLPLALDQAGAYIKAGQSSLTKYLDLYRRHRKALLGERGEKVPEHPDTVATTWSLSFQQVEQRNLAAAELLQLCAFLSPDAIPEEIILKGAAHFPPALQQIATSDLLMDKAIATLGIYSLVQRDPAGKTLSIHRLVQAVLQDELDEAALHTWARRAILAVNEAFPEAPFVEWAQCERLLPHVLACVTWIEQRPTLEAASLLDKVGSFLREQGQYAEAKHLLEVAISIREQHLEAEDLLATSLSNLAGLFSYQGKYAEAEQLVKRALAIRERVLGGEHPDTATSLSHQALLFMQQGKYAQAERLFERVLAIYRKSLGTHDLTVARTMGNLAVLYEGQGRYKQAEQSNEQALSIYRQHLEPTHPAIARTMSNLALISWRLRKYEEAKKLFEQVLSIQESEILDAAYSLAGLAEISLELGEYEQAEKYYKQALAIREQHLEADHPDRAEAMEGLADVYREQKRYTEAEELYHQALQIWERKFGPESLQMTRSLTGLAHLAREQKKYAEAEHFSGRASRIHEKSVISERPDTGEAPHNTAQLQELQEDSN